MSDAIFRLECGAAVVNAVQMAVAEGGFCGEQLDLALCGVHDLLLDIIKDFRDDVGTAKEITG